MIREILKNPEAPLFSNEAFPLITEVCFGENSEFDYRNDEAVAGKAAAIIIFGTSGLSSLMGCVSHLLDVYKKTQAKKVFITGGRQNGFTMAESEIILDLIRRDLRSSILPSSDDFFCIEKESTNTLENVIEAKKLGLDGFERIIFISKCYHCGRCYLTLKKYFPDKIIFQRGYVCELSDILPVISRNLWVAHPQNISRVFGELLRIKHYGERGDIMYPNSIRKKVERVMELAK